VLLVLHTKALNQILLGPRFVGLFHPEEVHSVNIGGMAHVGLYVLTRLEKTIPNRFDVQTEVTHCSIDICMI